MRLTLSILLFLPILGIGQHNMTLSGYLDLATMHATEMNDIWGYTDETNIEYALV